jgi:Ni,Fe-hydrogenase III large subunit
MSDLTDLLSTGTPVAGHAPWPRVVVGTGGWEEAGRLLVAGELTLLGLWGEAGWAHMAVLGGAAPAEVAVLSVACLHGGFPSIGRMHPPAIRLERAARDLFGLDPLGLPDTRKWLDHGTATGGMPEAYAFLPVEGEDLHEIPVGPVHAGVIEPGHFRFTCDGETVVRLEQRLGYTHKGVEALLAGTNFADAARIAGRISGDSTVAYAFAFARAVEAAARMEVPPRAQLLRGLMAELERLANHLGDFGAICNDAAFAIMLVHCGLLRERVLRTNVACFGHRLAMDAVVPGGVAADLTAEGVAAVRALLAELDRRFPALVDLYDNTASLQDRTVGTGHVDKALARQFGAGGPVGRGAGRSFDARRDLAYPPYDALEFSVPVFEAGDVDARVWVRIKEIEQSRSLIAQILAALQPGDIRLPDAALASASGHEGMALTEAFRGDVLCWLRVGEDGKIARCHFRDASWFQWPLLEAAIEGNIVADFPLCNKSFNCSYSGHDL